MMRTVELNGQTYEFEATAEEFAVWLKDRAITDAVTIRLRERYHTDDAVLAALARGEGRPEKADFDAATAAITQALEPAPAPRGLLSFEKE